MAVRTRFAPSPTGDLHLGGARTALYAWLFARRQGGQFVLRIEDTDRERSTSIATQGILEGLAWLGIAWDEGPLYQSDRLARYREVLAQLLQSEKAYYCTCSPERLAKLRADQMAAGVKPKYDGHCRSLRLSKPEGPHVVRFKNPRSGTVSFEDAIRGRLSLENEELDDLILCRSDGMPTYNFCVVVDDWQMQISHVIRGDDHINNTFRQIQLLQALNAPIPIYAHVAMILDEQGNKLSKRTAAASLLAYRAQGILPEALLNYLARLGWGHGNEEIFSKSQLVELFDLSHVSRGPSSFDVKKLLWLNHYYLQQHSPESLWALLSDFLSEAIRTALPEATALSGVRLFQSRAHSLVELAALVTPFLIGPEAQTGVEEVEWWPSLIECLSSTDLAWQREGLSSALKAWTLAQKLPMRAIGKALRLALLGCEEAPGYGLLLEALGREASLRRLRMRQN